MRYFVHLPTSWLILAGALLLAGCGQPEEPAPEPDAQAAERPAQVPDGVPATGTLRVAADFDASEIRLHFEFDTDQPGWHHQVWRYQDGRWQRYGSGSDGPDQYGLYEDRISMLLDDGLVDGFAQYGGWMTVHEGMRSLDSAVAGEEVAAHPVLGEGMGRSDVRKFLPQTRTDDAVSWDALQDPEELAAMQARGQFLDLWQWRAHRSHPVGYADNGYVLHYRLSSEGRSMYTTNRDDDAEQPAYMFDPDATGQHALRWEALINGDYGQDDLYYLSRDHAVPFDPDHDWQEGDVIPYRLLQTPDGSRGAIRAEGGYSDGAWRITLSRSLESPNSLDSKRLQDQGLYNVAFAVHTGGVGARWHLVSQPLTMGLGRNDGDIQVVRNPAGIADALIWTEVELAQPGQVTWQQVRGGQPNSD